MVSLGLGVEPLQGQAKRQNWAVCLRDWINEQIAPYHADQVIVLSLASLGKLLFLKVKGFGQQNAQDRQMAEFHPRLEYRRGAPEGLTLHTSAGLRKYLDDRERNDFVEAARCMSLELRTLCLTLALTGCRISEALALTSDSLRLAEGAIAFRSLKKRSQSVFIREVPVPADLLEDLSQLAQVAANNGRRRLWRWGRARAWQIVKATMLGAGVKAGPHQTAKGLRHAFGLHAVRCGVPITFVQRWLGHASLSTTAIYLQAIGPEERAIASRMWH